MLDVFTSRYFFTFLANLFDLTLRSNLSSGGNSPIPPFGGTPPATFHFAPPDVVFYLTKRILHGMPIAVRVAVPNGQGD